MSKDISTSSFLFISDREAAKKMGISNYDWRRWYVQSKVGSYYNICGGIIKIEFPNGFKKVLRTGNLAKRLDDIIYQLMSPRNKLCKDTWIRKLKAGREPFSYKEINELKITIIKDEGKL